MSILIAIVESKFNPNNYRETKGINILNFVYQNPISQVDFFSVPVAFEIIKKIEQFLDKKSGKVKRRSTISKNELLRNCLYVLHYSNIKSDKTVALSLEDKSDGKFKRVDEQDIPTNQTVSVYLKGLDFPVLLVKQIFTNKDGSQGVLYAVTNNLELN